MTERLLELLLLSIDRGTFKKAVFSKNFDPMNEKTVLSLLQIGTKPTLQAETFRKDHKAVQENFAPSDREKLTALISSCRQVNLISSVGECELRTSKSGTATLIGGEKLFRSLSASERVDVVLRANDRKKERILTGEEPFLRYLGVSDENGRVKDKKQAKFRQINRFLELIRDCLPYLPSEGKLRICDLCCGKSYLSFATYHYFANLLGREVEMTGVDLKEDVMQSCNRVAEELGFSGLHFFCRDISAYEVEGPVHLVLSLHACDIATDYVLSFATRNRADVILSTPCCHHELNRELSCETLSFLSGYSMLRQKFCDAATDALRLKYLEACGYDVAALELIDPEETPKNIMLRGLKRKNFDPVSKEFEQKRKEYLEARRFLTGGSDRVQSILFPFEKE